MIAGCRTGVELPNRMGSARHTTTPRRLAHRPRVRVRATAILPLVVAALFAAHGRAQNSPAAGQQVRASASGLPPGTPIYAALAKTINANKAKAGDAVVARVTFPVLLHGQIFIDNGARIIGHVTQAKKRSRSSAISELGIVFDHVVLKSRKRLPLDLTVQAIGFEPITPRELAQSDAEQNPFPPDPTTPVNATRHSTPPLPERLPQAGNAPDPDRPASESSHPALDAGSKGMVNLPGLTLAEGTEEKQASVVSSKAKNVKLERGYSLVLRVIALDTAAQDKQR